MDLLPKSAEPGEIVVPPPPPPPPGSPGAPYSSLTEPPLLAGEETFEAPSVVRMLIPSVITLRCIHYQLHQLHQLPSSVFIANARTMTDCQSQAGRDA